MNNKIKSFCFVSLLATNISYAAPPCDGFEIKIKNAVAEDLLVTTIKLKGADIQPGGIQKIGSKKTQVFTVNSSNTNRPMNGEFKFHTISLPSKSVKIQFGLKNVGLVCEHTERSPKSDYAVNKTRLPGSVDYTITNK